MLYLVLMHRTTNMTRPLTTRPQPITPQVAARYWHATRARDRRADGTFVLAVRSTRIYCRPSCPARRPLRRNVTFYRTREEAERHGYRPCLRCRPNEISGPVALVQRAAGLLAQSTEEGLTLCQLAETLGATQSTLRRAFLQVTGLKPHEFVQALRLNRFKALMRAGKSITDALYETGYGSSSRVYEGSNAQLGMTPATYRKGGMGMKLGYTIVKSPLGKVLVAATERGVSAVYLGDDETSLVAELGEEYPRAEIAAASNGFERWVKEVLQRIEGRPPHIELPLDLQATAFQRRVWKELQRIPRGSTRTYSQVAHPVGRAKAVPDLRVSARRPAGNALHLDRKSTRMYS